jgi:radical SAM protein with 4Fe4S-binding SPASM domain
VERDVYSLERIMNEMVYHAEDFFISPWNKKNVFNFKINLDRGEYMCRLSLLIDWIKIACLGDVIKFQINIATGLLLNKSIEISDISDLDRLDFNFKLNENCDCEFSLSVRFGGLNERDVLCRSLSLFKNYSISENINFRVDRKTLPLKRIRNVVVGTSSICNANCFHCPTNKPELGLNPNKYMDLNLFEKLIVGLANSKLKIEGYMSFGLFGEALADRYINERVKLVRKYLPDVRLQLNTNGGAFVMTKHAGAVEEADEVHIQCSGFSHELYEKMMFPLKRDIVYEKISQIIQSAKKTYIAVPVTAETLKEWHQIKDYWLKKGAYQIVPLAFSNRCANNLGYENLTLATAPGVCRGDILEDYIIDYDGKVLTCCQDFTRGNVIGDLLNASFNETLISPERNEFHEDMVCGNWSKHSHCSKCKFDHYGSVLRMIGEAERDVSLRNAD